MLHHFSDTKWPLRVFDAATSLIIYWTDAPAETETEKINSELLKLALYQQLFDPSLWPAAMRRFDSREEDGFVSAECGSSLTVHSIRLLSFFCIHSVFICSCLLCSSNTSHQTSPNAPRLDPTVRVCGLIVCLSSSLGCIPNSDCVAQLCTSCLKVTEEESKCEKKEKERK